MADRSLVLYVEDDPLWYETVLPIMREAGLRVVHLPMLEPAKGFFARHEREIAVVLLDSSIHQKNDGRVWASKLHAAGTKVIVFSGTNSPDVPSFCKGSFMHGQEFLRMVLDFVADSEVTKDAVVARQNTLNKFQRVV